MSAMSQPVLIKTYGNIYPASKELLRELAARMQDAIPAGNVTVANGDMLLLSFEGIYFPLEEVLAGIERHITGQSAGKLDYLDLEAWRLTRFRIENGKISSSSAPLNNVLDYSGH